jgi:hypothetical protein
VSWQQHSGENNTRNMNNSEMDPASQLSGGKALDSPEQLTGCDRKLIERLKREERKRFGTLGFSFLFGALFILLHWNAPFACQKMWQTPYSAVSKDTLYEALFITPWLGGVFVIVRGIYDSFFNRRRRLLLKLATRYEQCRNKAA